MNIPFLILCFITGLTASCAVGPIFILTFNSGALYGFQKGFATALGAAVADGVFFSLGLYGALTLIEKSKHLIIAMDVIGAIILCYLGIRTIQKSYERKISLPSNLGIILSAFKAFLITIVNPLIAIFFMFISIQITPESLQPMTSGTVILASLSVISGSLTTLTFIAYIASNIGRAINRKWLHYVSYISSAVFLAAGTYLVIDIVKRTFL